MKLNETSPMDERTESERRARITYLMVETNEDEWLVRLGCTKSRTSLKRRLQNHQAANSRKLFFYKTWDRSDYDDAGYDLEQAVLAAFDGDRVRIDGKASDWILNVHPDVIIRWVEENCS